MDVTDVMDAMDAMDANGGEEIGDIDIDLLLHAIILGGILFIGLEVLAKMVVLV